MNDKDIIAKLEREKAELQLALDKANAFIDRAFEAHPNLDVDVDFIKACHET